MVMGDGDCGEAVSGACTAILELLHNPPEIASSGSILSLLYSIIDAVDDMGGTLGAIFGIFLSSLVTSLRSSSKSTSTITIPSSEILAAAVHAATTALKKIHRSPGRRSDCHGCSPPFLGFLLPKQGFRESGQGRKGESRSDEISEAEVWAGELCWGGRQGAGVAGSGSLGSDGDFGRFEVWHGLSSRQ